jgi:hypothetical protein
VKLYRSGSVLLPVLCTATALLRSFFKPGAVTASAQSGGDNSPKRAKKEKKAVAKTSPKKSLAKKAVVKSDPKANGTIL